MKEIKFEFNYRDDKEFKKIYHKLVSDLKKQYGRKKFLEMVITAQEINGLEMKKIRTKYWYNVKSFKNNMVPAKRMNLLISIPD